MFLAPHRPKITVVVVVVIVAGGGCCYPCNFFLFRSGRRSSNRRCFRVYFQILGANNTVNTDIFFPRKPVLGLTLGLFFFRVSDRV